MNFQECAAAMARAAAKLDSNRSVLESIAMIIQKEARAMLGTYQSGSGGIPGWPELSETTREHRKMLGYPENQPLLRSGELRDAIEFSVDSFCASIGVPHRMVGSPHDEKNELRDIGDVALNMELSHGVEGMFWRSFLAMAAVRRAKDIEALIAADVFVRLGGA